MCLKLVKSIPAGVKIYSKLLFRSHTHTVKRQSRWRSKCWFVPWEAGAWQAAEQLNMEDILISGGQENQCCAVSFFSKGAEHVAVNWGAEPADTEGLPVYHEDGEPDQRTPVKVQADWIGQEDTHQQKLSGMSLFKTMEKHQINTDQKLKLSQGLVVYI